MTTSVNYSNIIYRKVGVNMIHNYYNSQVNPVKVEGKWINTRAEKKVRYYHFNKDKQQETTVYEKERRSIDLLKMALKRVSKPVVSCSFGIDSILTLYLVRKALKELDRDESDIDVVWNDTLNEFPLVRKYAKEITDKWNLRLLVYKPEKPLKKIIEDNGGITSDYFTARKGDRRNGQPLSEKCCGTLKHKPMKKAIKENSWDLIINGLRADESNQRLLAGLRDGEFFYSSHEWKALTCRPIQWWKEKDVWGYVKKEQIQYNGLYDQNTLKVYPLDNEEIVINNLSDFESLGINPQEMIDQTLLVFNIYQSRFLETLGYKLFTPRTGCQMCPIPVKYGYLQFMRINYPKVYHAMVHKLGYGHALLDMVPDHIKKEVKSLTGIDMNVIEATEQLEEVLTAKPCLFDNFGK